MKPRPIVKAETLYGGPMTLTPEGTHPSTAASVESATARFPDAYEWPNHPGFGRWSEQLLHQLMRMPLEGRQAAVEEALQAAFIEGKGYVRAEAL